MDSLSNGILSFSSSGNHLYACTTTKGIFYSIDSGYSWNECNNGISLTYMNARSIATKDSILIAGANQGLFKSTNFGMSWTPITNGVTCLDINDVIFKGDSILVGSYGGGIFLSLNYGQSFTNINNGFSAHLYIRCLFQNGSRIFSGHSWDGGGILASDDNCASWIQKNNGVPFNPWNLSKYDDILDFTTNGQSLFASTWDCGILKSTDNGESWVQIQVGNNSVFNYINSITNNNGVVFSGCYGTGVYKSHDDGITWIEINDSLSDYSVDAIFVFGPYLYAGTTRGHVFRRPLSELVVGTSNTKSTSESIVFPNPVIDYSKLNIPNYSSGEYILDIYSPVGCLVNEIREPKANYFMISKQDYKPGIYIYLLTKNSYNISTGKFIVF